MPSTAARAFMSAQDLQKALASTYLADDRTALSAWLSLRMLKPLLIEGPPGVGKTDLARALAETLGRPMVRLQCYEGLDESKALYEWDYTKQILFAELLRDAAYERTSRKGSLADAVRQLASEAGAFFDESFLVQRPLLSAIRSQVPVVLLIDEVDRADPEFEAFLLEMLAENQVTIPELGTLRAEHPPLVVLTTNGTRDMSDALRRRCLHLFIDYPPPSREQKILELRVPGLPQDLAKQLTHFVSGLRTLSLQKSPSIAETLDWARALMLLGASALTPALAADTLSLLLKHEDDRAQVLPLTEKLAKR